MEEKLIEEVKKHKCIFVRSCLAYCSRHTRTEAWESVGEALGYSVLVCKTRWKSLRDRYLREYQQTQFGSSSDWKFFEMMDFIRPTKTLPGPTASKDSYCLTDGEELTCEALQLIDEIKKHKSIYDKTCLTYCNRKIRAEAWKSISETLGYTVLVCKARWKNLRDRYVRESQLESGSDWKYFDVMDFMRPRNAVTDAKEPFYSVEQPELNYELLIEEVKKHKAIYDKTCLSYRIRKVRAEAWKSISDALGIPTELCQSRWKSLRDRYVRETQHLLGSADEVYQIRWKPYNLLGFLRQQVEPKQAIPTLDAESEQLNFDAIIETESEADDCEEFDMMDFIKPRIAANSITDSKDSFSSSSETEQVKCEPLLNISDEIEITEESPKKNRGKRRPSSTVQSDDSYSSSPPQEVNPEKRYCPAQAPTEHDEHQGFFLMCNELFRKLSTHKVDDAKVFFINHLHGQIKEMWDE